MATAYHNLSDYDFNSVPNAENMRFGIVVSEWNNNITGPLLEGAISTLKKHGAKDKNILPKDGSKIEILNAQLGSFRGNMQIIFHTKDDYKELK